MPRLVALLVSLPLWILAQDGGTVQGIVTNRATNAGLGGVAVTLWTQQAVRYTATTDETGAWRISGIKPGRYSSRFEKSGFLEPPPANPFAEAPLAVGTGSVPIQLNAELVPLATLRGRVLDPNGEPAADVDVECSTLATTKTDGNGQFVLTGVRPGSYILRAIPKPASGTPSESQRNETVSTYYPSAIDRVQASRIEIRGGEDLSGLDIRLRSSPVYRVRGIGVDESGKPVPNATVQLFSHSSESALTGQMNIAGVRYFFGSAAPQRVEAETVSRADGSFEFPSVRPGEWQLRAETEPKRDSERNLTLSRSEILDSTVTDHDLDDVRLHFPQTFNLRLSVDWGDRPPSDPKTRNFVAVLLIPTDEPGVTVPRIPTKGGETLQIENVAAGRYRIVPLPGTPPGYYPAAVLLDGRDLTGQTVELNVATPLLRLVYKPNAGTLRGIVDKGEGATVLLWPQSASVLDLLRAVQAGPGGVFEMQNVAPGDYSLLAVDSQHLEAEPEEVIRTFTASATPVHVDEGSSPSVSLPLTHLPE